MRTARTTVTARVNALATLRSEAESRGIPLNAVLAEALEEKARKLRSRRRPRIGVAPSSDGRSAREVTAEPVVEPPS